MREESLNSLLLNNIGVRLIEMGRYKQGASILRQSVSAMKSAFQQNFMKDQESVAVAEDSRQVSKALKLLSKLDRDSQTDLPLEILTYDASLVPLVTLEASEQGSNVVRLVCFHLQDIEAASDRDMQNEAIIVVNNLTVSYLLMIHTFTESDGCCCAPKLELSYGKSLELANGLIRECALDCHDAVGQLRLLVISLLVTGNALAIVRSSQDGTVARQQDDEPVLREKYNRILVKVRESPVLHFFNRRCLVGAAAA